MLGPALLARGMTTSGVIDGLGRRWQYHPRSDRHAMLGSLAVAVDVLAASDALREHTRRGNLVFALRAPVTDPTTGHRSRVDLVVGPPASSADPLAPCLIDLVEAYGVVLDPAERAAFEYVPALRQGRPATIRTAVTSKASMSLRGATVRRLQDELISTATTVRSSAPDAVLIAHVLVNVATRFTSPLTGSTSTRSGRQPRGIPVPHDRSGDGAWGFDALAASALVMGNDGTEVRPAPEPEWSASYSAAIRAAADLYTTRFTTL